MISNIIILPISIPFAAAVLVLIMPAGMFHRRGVISESKEPTAAVYS